MGYELVPLEASQTEASVWIGVTSQPSGLELDVAGTARPIDSSWTRWDAHGVPAVWAQRMTMTGLEPGRRYPLRLLEGGQERALGTATTLPAALPLLDQPALSILLGSCFAHERDAGAASAAFAGLPLAARPHFKLLCGDQVYLDAPFPRFLITKFGDNDLQVVHLKTYLDSWGLVGGRTGLGGILAEGATFLSSDDHEYWNNAPERGAVVRNTWGDGDRQHWRALATALYQTFQAAQPSAAFSIGQLSFLVLDTRVARADDRSVFVSPVELERLRAWVGSLSGPGMLVLGQVVFADRAGWKGHFLDWGLPDFDQYAEFVRILMGSQHDIVVLTGDVHFGRVSGCMLPTGRSLIEVISSPLALVDERAGGTWHQPPGLFPAFGIPGTTQRPVWSAGGYHVTGNHFATVELHSLGARVRMTVRAWPIPTGGSRPASAALFERDLD
jgi:hypothetical protein